MNEKSDQNIHEVAAELIERELPISSTTPAKQDLTIAAQPPNSNSITPTSSVTEVPASGLKAPTNFGPSPSSVSKIGRPCSHAAPKAGPPPRGEYRTLKIL